MNKCSLFDMDFAKIIEDAFGASVDRLRELAQADREGISPCTFCRFNPPLDIVNSAPTIDAVRVAGGCYCQECKYADYPIGPNILCKKFYGAGSIDGFCYWGQRKEDEHEAR